MKKLLTLLLSLLLIATMSGCDGGGGNGDKFDPAALLSALEENSWFVEDETRLFVRFDAEKKTVERTIDQTSYYMCENITDIRKTGNNAFEIDAHHDGRHDEETDYDEGTTTFRIEYDLNDPTVLKATFVAGDNAEGPYMLHSDKGMSGDELLKFLQENGPYANYENMNQFVAEADAWMICDRTIVDYEKTEDEYILVKSITYKGFNNYEFVIDYDDEEWTFTMHIEKDTPDSFYIFADDNYAYYVTDVGMDRIKLLDVLVGGNIYLDETGEMAVLFDNSLGTITINWLKKDKTREFGIDDLVYNGCNNYRYLVHDTTSNTQYLIYIRYHVTDGRIGLRLDELEIDRGFDPHH
ncbi:MAG: hypothetical protein IKX74_02790 [Erysipelotrichaceae bacterium]|nr:hypothetical protein [Erysipelotrichaceae bacterium]MBR5048562.1 hypothetical protein [Erysipelotrichaceae bacterium]